MAARLANDKSPAPDAAAARAVDLGECRSSRLAEGLYECAPNGPAAAAAPGFEGFDDTFSMGYDARARSDQQGHDDFDGTLLRPVRRAACPPFVH